MLLRRDFLAAASTVPRLVARSPGSFQKGVNFTAEHPDFYGSEGALGMLRRLPRYGISFIALVPYGMSRPGLPAVRFNPRRSWENDAGIRTLAAEARTLGLGVFLKPQIWTGSGFPGDLDFPREEDRRQWFSSYRAFLEHYASLATEIGASLFSAGVEFVRLSAHEKPWRELIAAARKVYAGPITYCACQGPEFEQLRFWDAVDYIGLNNYYPLPDDLSTAEVLRRIETVHRRFAKPVIFAEAGFASLENAHRQPWEETPRRIDPAHQARCYEAVFRAFYGRPWFQGVYWWKIGTNGFGGPEDGSHTPWRKPAMDVISRWYRNGGRS